MSVSRKEQVDRIEHFESLWRRLTSLYLDREKFEDVSAATENEFLALQGAIMQELAGLAELEEGRFSLIQEVTSVINEAISLRYLRDHSEFQIRRRKERGHQVAELIANFKRFVAERDASVRRKEKEMESKLSQPFYDPEKGKFGTILGRIATSPVRFFSAMRVAGEARKANSFLLTLLSLVSIGCFIILAILNASAVRRMCYNFALETGILTSDVGLGARIVIWLLAVVGIALVSVVGALVAAILAHALAFLVHLGFKVAGGKGDMVASHKVVIFGLAPLLLLIAVPLLGHFARRGDLSPAFVTGLLAAAACYMGILHVIGFNKVHHAPIPAGIMGWMMGAVLFVVTVLAALYVWHAAAGTLPPSSGKYVYVTVQEGSATGPGEARYVYSKGEILDFVEEEEDFLLVQHGENEVRIKKTEAEIREASLLSLPGFLVEHSVARAEALMYRVSRKIDR